MSFLGGRKGGVLTFSVGDEETVDVDIPSSVLLVRLGCLGLGGVDGGERFGKEVVALSLLNAILSGSFKRDG